MATTQQQTFNPTFSNPDDMPEYVSIYDKPKRRAMTKEEKAQKNRDNYKAYYYADPERERERKRRERVRKKEDAKKIVV